MSNRKPYSPSVHAHRVLRQETSAQTTRQATRGIEVVYYLKLADGNIKIGTSRQAVDRLRQHRKRFGDFEPLAVELGGRDLEAERHRQFAHLRVGRAEHFQPGPDLLDLIDSLRSALGLTA